MSIQALAWAIEQPIPGAAKLLLMALANHADHSTGRIHFDAALLAREASLQQRSLSRYLGALERNGYVAKDEKRVSDGDKRVYWLTFDRDPAAPWSWSAQDREDGDGEVTAPATAPADRSTTPTSFRRDRQLEARKAATALPPDRPADKVPVIEGSDAFRAWCRHYRDRRMVVPFVHTVITSDGSYRRGFYMLSLFPPDAPADAAGKVDNQ